MQSHSWHLIEDGHKVYVVCRFCLMCIVCLSFTLLIVCIHGKGGRKADSLFFFFLSDCIIIAVVTSDVWVKWWLVNMYMCVNVLICESDTRPL